MFKEYNANPINKKVGDCTVRALSVVLNQPWHDTYIDMMIEGYIMCDIPSANMVWGNYLKKKGYKRKALPDSCPECYSVKRFCKDYPDGTYLLALSGHVVAVINGDYYDTWDSGEETPIYYWHKEE